MSAIYAMWKINKYNDVWINWENSAKDILFHILEKKKIKKCNLKLKIGFNIRSSKVGMCVIPELIFENF